MMGRLTRHAVTGAAAIGLVTIAEAGCSHDDSTIFIRGLLAPPQSATGGSCAYSAEPSNTYLFSGVFDIGLLSTYQPVALVGNQMLARQSNEDLRTETSRVTIQGATVQVSDAVNTPVKSFTSLAAGFADPGASNAPGFGTVAVTLIDPDTTNSLRSSIPVHGTRRLIVRFKVFGQTLGGQSLESDEFQFPIDVCNGCLVVFPADSQDNALAQAENKPNCKAPLTSSGSSGAQSYPPPCVVGQEQLVDCRLCQGNAVCDPAQR